MILVLDTSALIKRYITEDDSERVNATWNNANTHCASWITEAEALATFARKRREGVLNAKDLDAAELRFLNDWPAFTRIEPYRISSLLPNLHRAYPLRGADSIHLATALLLRFLLPGEEIIFGTADGKLAVAAQLEKLKVIP